MLSQRNEPVGEFTLPEAIFAQPVRRHLLYEVVRMQQANRRAGTAATKTRAFVRGGGKKPWKQKGTGRARAGSSRSPIWVGGATIFGPQPRDYSYRLPASARRVALASALSMKAREGKLVLLDKIEIESAKTKHVVKMMSDLQIKSGLIIVAAKDEALERATRNLPKVKVLRAAGANVYDLLKYEYLILTPDALSALVARVA
ncbi:MAG: 50S ribosomal protein L4 [Deltaproteobacteria bacterium]|nr:50S ribosomal protein L4 [Deltaproteobacteria bacterium]MBI3391048.1 50S ribosomal protein L4 [Deltaproteobacteria bacterium]